MFAMYVKVLKVR